MLLTLPCGWLTRLDGDFFAVDYQISTRPAMPMITCAI
jgi:hypothetical protein